MLTAEKPSTAKAYSRQFISLSGVDAAELVDEPLERAQHRVQPGALPFKNAGQINAHRTNGRQQNERVDGKLQPAIGGHVRISPEKQGEGQITQQQNGKNKRDDSDRSQFAWVTSTSGMP